MVNNTSKNKTGIDISKQMYCVKALAIFSVCFAHCFFENEAISKLTGFIGSIGVPIFVIVSGYYYNKKNNRWTLILNRAKTLLIPFLFFSIGTYIIQCLSGLLNMNIHSFLNWIIGNNNWLYFIPSLFVCYIILTVYIFKLDNELIAFIICILINIFEINTDITFINVLPCFLLYFTVGYILKKHNIIYKLKCNILHIILILFLLLFMYNFTFPILIDKIIHIALSIELINISYYLKEISFIENIGRNTYPIYFLHAQVGIGISNLIMQLILGYNVKATTSYLVSVIRPTIAFIICIVIIELVIYVFKSLKIEKALSLFGIKY